MMKKVQKNLIKGRLIKINQGELNLDSFYKTIEYLTNLFKIEIRYPSCIIFIS